MKRPIIILFITLVTARISMMGSCDIDIDAIDRLNITMQEFNDLLDEHSTEWQNLVDSLSTSWQNHTEEQIGKLIQESDQFQALFSEFNNNTAAFLEEVKALHKDLPEYLHWAVVDIERVLNEAIGGVSSNVLCISGYLQMQVIQTLDYIMAKVQLEQSFSTTDEFVQPGFCHLSLSSIDMQLPQHLRRELVMSGFDLTLEVVNEMDVFLEREGFRQELNDRLTRANSQQLTLDISSDENGVDFDEILKNFKRFTIEYQGVQMSQIPILN